ncbi:MAG: S-methyl-5'-thioadenosine phosphorylase [Bacteroidota bacterium]|nr:S-methyl-5'-thioadenosine phosphorylase [Bacteroidota bacterium]
MKRIGIIGGSGLENPQILTNAKEIEITTKYGKTSSLIHTGQINNVDVAIISRHGRKHTIQPTRVNNKANIAALKEYGCTHIIATTAVGSLRKDIEPGDLIIIDQFIDFTRLRELSFVEEFEPNQPVHTSMADPFDKNLREILIKSADALELKYHKTGTVVTIEGPRFSTRAESKMFRIWGADIINMSIAPEVILANEAEIPYAAVAMSTDYDCWLENEEPVTWEKVLETFSKNVEKVTKLLLKSFEI